MSTSKIVDETRTLCVNGCGVERAKRPGRPAPPEDPDEFVTDDDDAFADIAIDRQQVQRFDLDRLDGVQTFGAGEDPDVMVARPDGVPDHWTAR